MISCLDLTVPLGLVQTIIQLPFHIAILSYYNILFLTTMHQVGLKILYNVLTLLLQLKKFKQFHSGFVELLKLCDILIFMLISVMIKCDDCKIVFCWPKRKLNNHFIINS